MYQTSLKDFIPGSKAPELKIRLECYLVYLKKYKEMHPHAHFEVITNTSHSVLSPSKELLIEAGILPKEDGTKNPKMPFEEYEPLFIQEMMKNEKAIERMKELIEIAKIKDVFLVCFCKNPFECHRSLVAKIMKQLSKEGES